MWKRRKPYSHKNTKATEWLVLSLEMAKIEVCDSPSSGVTNRSCLQGAIYEKLYAPGSTRVLSERQRQGQELIMQIHEVLSMNEKVSVFLARWWLHD